MNAKTLISALLLALLLASPAMAKKHHHAAPKHKAATAPAAPTWEGEFPPSKTPFKAPAGFTVQVLDPIGARALKPKGWFYDRAYDPRGYTWIISRENPTKAPGYQTGLRVQLLQSVRQGTKQWPHDFVADYFKKKTGAAKALPSSLGDCAGVVSSLHRACLEQEDTVPGQGKQKFRIAYAGFWNDTTDTVIIMTFGAPATDWKKVHDTATLMMNQIDLPDVEQKLQEMAASKARGCSTAMKHLPEEKLYSYVQAGDKGAKGLFTVAGIGNEYFAIGPDDPHPMSASDFAAAIKASPDYAPDKKIILHWPYSTAGKAPFAKALHDVLGNEVAGADGPLWWYPDGSSVVTDPKIGFQLPTTQNVIQCFRSDGESLTGPACHKMIAGFDPSQAIFGNTIFMPQDCGALGVMAFNAIMGQRDDSFALYLYYSFVNPSRDKAATYLSLASFGHQALAEYYAAQEVRGSQPDLYRQLLSHAARDGDKKAAAELRH
jgi:hypothetical protein